MVWGMIQPWRRWWGLGDARFGSAFGVFVFVRRSGEPGSRRSPSAADPGDRERSAVPPERLLRALLLQAFYGIRSERQIMERLEYDLLFRWFVGLGVDDAAWDQTTFGKNRDRLLAGDVARKF